MGGVIKTLVAVGEYWVARSEIYGGGGAYEDIAGCYMQIALF